MRSVRRPARLAVWGTAVAGTLMGHAVAYIVAIPGSAHRARHLEDAGHSYLAAAAWLAAAAGAASVALVLVRHARARGGVPLGIHGLAARVLALQMLGYVLLEAVERALVGASPLEALDHHILVVGLAVQILVAIASALVLRWLARFGEMIARLLARRPDGRARAPSWSGSREPALRRPRLSGTLVARAPPASSSC